MAWWHWVLLGVMLAVAGWSVVKEMAHWHGQDHLITTLIKKPDTRFSGVDEEARLRSKEYRQAAEKIRQRAHSIRSRRTVSPEGTNVRQMDVRRRN